MSFAKQHSNLCKGFRAVPRWFRRSPFWQSLRAEHRAVLDELYHRVASEPVSLPGLKHEIMRGQWAISFPDLAKASGATVQNVKTAVKLAEKQSIIKHEEIYLKGPKSTVHLSLFTWLDYDTYDLPNTPSNLPTNLPDNLPPSLPTNRTCIRHNNKDTMENTNKDTRETLPATAGKAAGAAGGSSRHDQETNGVIVETAEPPHENANGGAMKEMTHPPTDVQGGSFDVPMARGEPIMDDDVADDILAAMGRPDQPAPDEFGGLGTWSDYPDQYAGTPEIRSGASVAPDGSSGGPASPDAPDGRSCSPETVPAAPSTSPDSPAPAVPQVREYAARTEKTTDADRERICKDAVSMGNWLCWGIAGVGHENPQSLPPTQTNWRVHGGTWDNPGFEKWTIPQIAAFYWLLVSNYRVDHQIPLTLPMMGVLIGNIKTLERTMPRQELWKYVNFMCTHFDLIKAINGNFGAKLALNERTLLHSTIQSTMSNTMLLSESSIRKEYRKYKLEQAD